jgi:hypothetical protein
VTGLGYATAALSLTGETAELTGSTVAVFGVNGTICRDPTATELRFSARRAMIDEAGNAVRLEGLSLSLFGLELPPLPIGEVRLNPNAPLETPYRLGLGDGLLLGVEGYPLPGAGRPAPQPPRPPPLHRPPALSFALAGGAGGAGFVLRQALDESLRLSLGADPPSGPTYSFYLDTGRQLTSPAFRSEPFEEARAGYAQAFALGPVAARAKLEVGEAWQPAAGADPARPATLERTAAFARVSGSAAWSGPLGPFAVGVTVRPSVAVYAEPFAVAGDLAGTLEARYETVPFGLGLRLGYSQGFGEPPIRAHVPETHTRASLSARLSPSLPAPPLGYAGLALERPRVNLGLELDLRQLSDPARRWRVQSLEVALDLLVYDGRVSLDGLGRPSRRPSSPSRRSSATTSRRRCAAPRPAPSARTSPSTRAASATPWAYTAPSSTSPTAAPCSVGASASDCGSAEG